MRRLHVINGIKQRLGEILGQQLSGGAVGDVTSWSIQAAMLSNMNRIVSAIVGNAPCGRVLRGLEIERASSNSIRISKGYGVTENGGVVSLCHQSSSSGIEVEIPATDATYYIHLKHNIIQLDSDDYPGRKSTGVVNDLGNVDIAYDEQAMAQGSDVTIADVVFYNTTGIVTDNNDMVYLGSVEVTGSVIPNPATIVLSTYRGLSPNRENNFDVFNFIEIVTQLNVDGHIQCNTIDAVGNVSLGAALEVADKSTLEEVETTGNVTVGGDLAVSGNIHASANVTIDDWLNVGTDLEVGEELTVVGKSTLGEVEATGNVTVGGNLAVTGAATIGEVTTSGDVNCSGSLKGKVEATDVEASGGIVASGSITSGGDIEATDEIEVTSKVNIKEDIEVYQWGRGIILTSPGGGHTLRLRLSDAGALELVSV